MADTNALAQDYCAQLADFLRTTPDAWTQGFSARNDRDLPCGANDPKAARWCALGLLEKFVPLKMHRPVQQLLLRVITPTGHLGVAVHQYNDHPKRTAADIERMFRCASFMPEPMEREVVREMSVKEIEEVCLYGFGMPPAAPTHNVVPLKDASAPKIVMIPDWGKLAALPLATGDNDINPLVLKPYQEQLAKAIITTMWPNLTASVAA